MSWSSRTSALLVALLLACGGSTAQPDAGPGDAALDGGPPLPAIQIACGQWRACVLREGGNVTCWGNGVPDMPRGPFTKIAAGVPVCGLRPSGEMVCWGSFSESAFPGEFTELSVNWQRGCATRIDGSVQCWAWSGGTDPPLDEPPPVPVRSVVAGDNNPCGLRKSDRFPICWGDTPPDSPLQAPARAVASAGLIACAIREDTSVINCWGTGNNGEEVPPPGEFTALRFSTGSYCASRPDGTIVCWGGITNYMLPDTPQGSFRDFCVGDSFGCGIHPDGTLACWGLNNRGQASPPPR